MNKSMTTSKNVTKTVIYVVCILLAALSIIPFWLMFVNATRSTVEIQGGISFIPSTYLAKNWEILVGKSFDPIAGFTNSMIVSVGSTALSVYFSAMTAFAIVAYHFKGRKAFFTFIMLVLMIPAQVSSIGFYQFIYKLGWSNNFLALILPAIAAPTMVFFMRQYLLGALSIEMLEAARNQRPQEFNTFNFIWLPIMTPAVATQAIFAFIGNWNNLFTPMILLTAKEKYTMPIMVQLLRGDIYRTEFGSIFSGLSFHCVSPFIVYFALSRYIIEGVALGGVKE